jgi:hypothetical protein
MQHCNMSLFHLLSQVYPEYAWLPWKFSRAQTTTLPQNTFELIVKYIQHNNLHNMRYDVILL